MIGAIASHYVATAAASSYAAEVLTDSPLVYWRLGESSGTTLADASGNSRAATLTAGTLGATGLVSGDSNTAITNPVATIASATWMNSAQLTVECLFKLSSLRGAGTGLVSRWGGSGFDWHLYVTAGGFLAAEFSDSTGATKSLAAPSAITLGQTYHAAASLDGTGFKLYQNGTQVASTTSSGSMWVAARKIDLGEMSDSTSTDMLGVLDEVAIYGAGLSGARIAAHATAAGV